MSLMDLLNILEIEQTYHIQFYVLRKMAITFGHECIWEEELTRKALWLIWIRSVMNWIDSFQEYEGRERFGEFGFYDVHVQPGGVTWHEANNHCVGLGRALLAIESAGENDAFENFLQQNEGKGDCKCRLWCY